MKINRSIEYGLIAAGYIAQHNKDGLISAERISKEYDIPLAYLLKILLQLVRVNVLKSKRGPHGGFTLARDAAEITMLEIIEAVDGPMMGHLLLAEQTSNAAFSLNMEEVCRKATQETMSVFQKSTLSTMIGG
jgi:Rrf2 family protein